MPALRRWRVRVLLACSMPALVIAGPVSWATAEPGGESIVVKGRAIRDGSAVGGARFQVRVWPKQAILENLPDGAVVDVRTVQTGNADGLGRYSVMLPADLPAQYLSTVGVNVEIIMSDGNQAATQQVTVRPDAMVATTLDFELGLATTGLGRAQAARGLSLGDQPATPGVGSATALGMGRTSAAAGGGCATSTGARHGPYMEKYADIWATAYVKGRVVHELGTSHTVGIGVKNAGSSTWSAGGTSGVSSSVGYDSTYTIADAAVYNKVWERYYYYTCVTSTGTYTTTYTRPDGFHSGPYYAHIAHVNYANCAATYAGHEYSRTTGANGTYAGGLDLPFIDLSAQSGWTSATEIHWKFSRAGQLCGSSGLPWSSAPRISANA